MGPELYHFGQEELDAMYAEGQERIERFRQALADDDLHVDLNGRCAACDVTWPCRVEGYRQAETRRNAAARKAAADAATPDGA